MWNLGRGEEGGELVVGLVETRVDVEEVSWVGGGRELFGHGGCLFQGENDRTYGFLESLSCTWIFSFIGHTHIYIYITRSL